MSEATLCGAEGMLGWHIARSGLDEVANTFSVDEVLDSAGGEAAVCLTVRLSDRPTRVGSRR